MHNQFRYKFNSAACGKCRGNCCRGSWGYVWVSDQERQQLADELELESARFERLYLRLVDRRWSLRERQVNGEYLCCFFDEVERKCRVYPVRPEQCRNFPFWEKFAGESKLKFEELSRECPGVQEVVSE